MSSDLPEAPQPQTDQEAPRAPGGADADASESDVGAGSDGPPVTPEGPLPRGARPAIPDELRTPEEPDTSEGSAVSEPSG
jgi:hypothetical protein